MNKAPYHTVKNSPIISWSFKTLFDGVLILLVFIVLIPNLISDRQLYKKVYVAPNIHQQTPVLLWEFRKYIRNQKDVYSVFAKGKPGALFIEGNWMEAPQLVLFLQDKIGKAKRIYIYGSCFAKGEVGQWAVHFLQETLNVAVAASTNITGELGDWVLEMNTDNDFREPILSTTLKVNF